jgi:hypothetical protein
MIKEATARIKINKLLESAGCRANSEMLNRLDRFSFAIATPSVTLR